jgi:hypothetical protein
LIANHPKANQATPDKRAEIRVFHPAETVGTLSKLTVWKGLARYEWYAHSRLLLSCVALWLVAVWTLPFYSNPGWILAFGMVYAVLAGPAFGGKDVLEGCEEFTLAQPATRGERFMVRLLLGGGMLLVFTLMDMIALGLDLSQAIARLYIDTGILRPVEVLTPRLLYGLVAAFPLTVFCLGFVLAANARSRSIVLAAWFWATLGALVVLRLGLFYEIWHWGAWTGYVACPGLLVATGLILWGGYRYYVNKEIAPSVKPLVIPTHWWLWGLLFLLGITLSLFLVNSILNEFVRILKQ